MSTSVITPRKLNLEESISISLPRKWFTNKKAEAYSSQVSMPYLQTPWLSIESEWKATGDIILESPPGHTKDDSRSIMQLRECLENMTAHISKLFRDQLYRDFKIFMGDDTKTYGLLKHNNTSSNFMRLKRAQNCDEDGKYVGGVMAIRVIFSVTSIHLIDDKISFSSHAHVVKYGEHVESDDVAASGIVVFDAEDMW